MIYIRIYQSLPKFGQIFYEHTVFKYVSKRSRDGKLDLILLKIKIHALF